MDALTEVREAQHEVAYAYQMMDYADPEFIDYSIMNYNAKVTRYEALLKMFKKEILQ